MELLLVRDLSTADVTLGTLSVGANKWQTLERPWIPFVGSPCGTKGISCVPVGDYDLAPHNGDAFQNVWALVNPTNWVFHWDTDVPLGLQNYARTAVLIHPANWAVELRGCCAVGMTRRLQPNGMWMIEHSRDAIEELRQAIGSEENLTLKIRYADEVDYHEPT